MAEEDVKKREPDSGSGTAAEVKVKVEPEAESWTSQLPSLPDLSGIDLGVDKVFSHSSATIASEQPKLQEECRGRYDLACTRPQPSKPTSTAVGSKAGARPGLIGRLHIGMILHPGPWKTVFFLIHFCLVVFFFVCYFVVLSWFYF